MFYESIFRQLNKYRVEYLVAGGVAVVLHGIVRFTADLDIFAKLSFENWDKFIRAMKELGYKAKLPVKLEDFAEESKRKEWIAKKNMKVFSFYHPKKHLELIDIFVKEYIDFDAAYKRRKMVRAKDINIPVVCIKDLKKLKKIAGRPQDLADIGSLEELERIEKGKK
ncbi:MAG: hypothetical protein JSV30_06255 [Candidatus Omnitrophota bacterium]|nr:MAG: hypothetical protein JSV30_06255 [Candidatus Omnitrophota bacterium]